MRYDRQEISNWFNCPALKAAQVYKTCFERFNLHNAWVHLWRIQWTFLLISPEKANSTYHPHTTKTNQDSGNLMVTSVLFSWPRNNPTHNPLFSFCYHIYNMLISDLINMLYMVWGAGRWILMLLAVSPVSSLYVKLTNGFIFTRSSPLTLTKKVKHITLKAFFPKMSFHLTVFFE